MTHGTPQKLFVIAGMPRSGSTFLYHNLQRHPAVFVPFRKEINYFNVNYDWPESRYRSHFDNAAPGQVCCDGSVLCFMHQGAERRIAEFDAETRVLLAVRDPVEFTLSLHAQVASAHYHVPPFSEFVAGYDLPVGGKLLRLDFADDFVSRRIEDFRRALGDRLLLYPHAALAEDPLAVLHRIEDFLGIERYFESDNFDPRRINASGRRNRVWLAWLLSHEAVVGLLRRTFPRRLILSARRRLDGLQAGGRPQRPTYADEDLALAERLFGAQRQRVEELFAAQTFLLGDGSALPERQLI